jgi:hypothetical protein
MHEKPNQSREQSRSEAELGAAIQACAAACLENPDPMRCIEAYVIGLIASGWTAQDAKKVQRGTMRVRATIKHDDLPPVE